MKKEIRNSILIGLLLSFTVLFVLGFLTIFNKNYIRRYMDKYNYYEIKYNDIKEQMEYLNKDYEYELSVDDVKEDINYYVSNNFESIQIHRRGLCKGERAWRARPANLRCLPERQSTGLPVREVRGVREGAQPVWTLSDVRERDRRGGREEVS